MKKIILFSALFFVCTAGTVFASDVECGKWEDVPSVKVQDNIKQGGYWQQREVVEDILKEICEYGLIRGFSEKEYGYGKSLSRVEMATIANRMVMGSDEYNDAADERNPETSYAVLSKYFSDTPSPKSDAYRWMINAMYYSSVENDIYNGDNSGSFPTTYRPFSGINIVEAFRVMVDAAQKGGVLKYDKKEELYGYSDPWWGNMMWFLQNEGVFYNLDADGQSFWFSEPLTLAYSNFASTISREDAAIFLYYLIHSDLIDGEELKEQL